MKRTLGGTLLVWLLLLSTPLCAQLFKRDPGDEIEQPDEEALQLPPPPKEENLLAFDPLYVSPFIFYVDTVSLKVGSTDRIVRYTLVIKSDRGAANISYEGLRCDTYERKIYAYATPEGKWSAPRDPQWKSVAGEKYRRTLFEKYFCPRSVVIGSAREGTDALRNGGHPSSPQNSD